MRSDLQEAKQAFDDAVDQIYTAYRFFASCVPQQEQFRPGKTICIGNIEFQKPSQAKSMEVELGWAFFTRLEAAFEAYTIRLGFNNPKSVSDKLCQSRQLSDWELRGLTAARELRNILHHGDGDVALLRNKPVEAQIEIGHEPHLYEENIRYFVDLFHKASEVLLKAMG